MLDFYWQIKCSLPKSTWNNFFFLLSHWNTTWTVFRSSNYFNIIVLCLFYLEYISKIFHSKKTTNFCSSFQLKHKEGTFNASDNFNLWKLSCSLISEASKCYDCFVVSWNENHVAIIWVVVGCLSDNCEIFVSDIISNFSWKIDFFCLSQYCLRGKELRLEGAFGS